MAMETSDTPELTSPEASYEQEMLQLRKKKLELQKESLELRKKKLLLMARNTRMQEVNFLVQHLSKLTFELPDNAHTVDATIKTAMQNIYEKIEAEFTPDQQQEIKKRIAASKKEQEEFEKGAYSESSQK